MFKMCLRLVKIIEFIVYRVELVYWSCLWGKVLSLGKWVDMVGLRGKLG